MPADACVLVIEDDASLRRSLCVTLKAAGYKSIEAESLNEAKRMAAHYRPALFLLDLGLPDGDGLDFIADVRAQLLTPIIVLTARDGEAMKVAALDAGADDYVTKPFGIDELLARMRAALRHGIQKQGAAPIVRTGDLEIDLGARIVRLRGARVDLTPKEYEILAALALQSGKIVRHRDLLQAVWGDPHADIQYLRVYVGQIRTKIEPDPKNPLYVLSEPALGYRLRAGQD